MAKHTNKILCGLLALSAGFVLASCDTVNALPTNYEEAVVSRVDGNEFKLDSNQIGKIWEAIVSGKTEYIHNEIIYQIAVDQFGTYFGEDGIYNIVTDKANPAYSAQKIMDFISAHANVFVREGDAKLAGYADASVADPYVVFEKVQEPRFVAFKKDIESRLAEKLYGEVTSGSYNDKQGRFSELRLALAHYFSGYKIENISIDSSGKASASTEVKWNTRYITSEVKKDDLSTIDGEVVHVSFFTEYIEKKLLRDIYSEKLIEEYVLQNKYSTLGRAYARNASYVKLSYNDDNKVFANKLLKVYAENYIYKDAEHKSAVPGEEITANTWRGLEDLTFDADGKLLTIEHGENYNAVLPAEFKLTSIVDQLVFEKKVDDTYKYHSVAIPLPSDASYDAKVEEARKVVLLAVGAADDTSGYVELEEAVVLRYEYFKESKVGDLFEKYFKACRAVIDGKSHQASSKDQSELDTFTGTNAHSRVKGVKDELSKLVLEDYTVDEWGLKNGGFSDLPSAVRERLFNINVANTVDNFTHDVKINETTYADDYIEQGARSELGNYAKSGIYSYVRDIYGCYYLNKADAQRYELDNYSFIFDEDSSYVVVNIKDAANSTKLNVDDVKGYFTIKAGQPLFTENTAREIAKLLGTKESYKTDAYQHYLEKYNLSFSDQELYDYFVTTYPDLYGEDD